MKNGSEIVGNRVKCKIVKNKLAPPFRVAEFDIMYGQGISRLSEVIDFAVMMDIIKKSGSWFSYEGERLCQGKDNVRKILEENPALAAEIEAKIRALKSKGDIVNEEDFEIDDEDEFDIRTIEDDE